MSHPFYLIDTTLRDGEQTPGVVFTREDKLSICDLLEKAGLSEIEVGTPAMSDEEVADIRAIVETKYAFKTLSWCRAVKEDIDKARRCGTNGVHISFPVSDIHLKAMGKDTEWVIQMVNLLIPEACDHFEYVTVGAQDASRASLPFLIDFINTVTRFKVLRVRIADTVGILNPMSAYERINKLKDCTENISLEFHAHNDLGMATANTLSAFAAGASCASVTVNGLGERAGNAALEEVVMAMELSMNIRTGINTGILGELSDLVSHASGISLSQQKAVTGSKVFTHESGIHTNLMLKDRNTYQIIKAGDIGREEQDFVFGKHSGKNALSELLKMNDIHISDEACNYMIRQLKRRSGELKRNLNKNEILVLANNSLKQQL